MTAVVTCKASSAAQSVCRQSSCMLLQQLAAVLLLVLRHQHTQQADPDVLLLFFSCSHPNLASIRTGRESTAGQAGTAWPSATGSAGPPAGAPTAAAGHNSNYQIAAHVPPDYVLSSPELYESPSAATRAYQRNTYTTSAGAHSCFSLARWGWGGTLMLHLMKASVLASSVGVGTVPEVRYGNNNPAPQL